MGIFGFTLPTFAEKFAESGSDYCLDLENKRALYNRERDNLFSEQMISIDPPESNNGEPVHVKVFNSYKYAQKYFKTMCKINKLDAGDPNFLRKFNKIGSELLKLSYSVNRIDGFIVQSVKKMKHPCPRNKDEKQVPIVVGKLIKQNQEGMLGNIKLPSNVFILLEKESAVHDHSGDGSIEGVEYIPWYYAHMDNKLKASGCPKCNFTKTGFHIESGFMTTPKWENKKNINLKSSKIRWSKFYITGTTSNIDLRNADLEGTVIQIVENVTGEINLEGANLTCAELSADDWKNIKLKGAKFNRTNVYGENCPKEIEAGCK